MYVVLVLSFLYPWLAYAGHFLPMSVLYLVIYILSLFNILLIFCDLKQSKLISVILVDMGTCVQCFPPSPAGHLTEWCACCRLSRHCSRQAFLNLRYVIRFIFIVWCTWCQATILAKASWYFIVLLCCAFNCCITDSFCVKHTLILGFYANIDFGGFYTICLTGSQYIGKFCALFLLKVVLLRENTVLCLNKSLSIS